jgi:predicted permease
MWWDTMVRDLRHAGRALARSASFTTVAVATLAIGIGAATAVFSVVDGVLLKPLPYPEADELVAVWHDAPGAPGITAVAGGLQLSPSMLVTYRENSRSFEQIGIWEPGALNLTGVAEPERVSTVSVTGQTLPAFGVAPLLGRWIDEGDERPGAVLVTMLSYEYWQRRFGGDPEVVGKRIELNSVGFEIVGVMPRGFRFGDTAADIISPLTIDRARLVPPPFCCTAVARLKDGVTLEQANADLERMLPIWIESFPFPGATAPARFYLDNWRIGPALRPFEDDVIGGVRDVLWVVMAMIGIVLLIASANVANLLLVRGEGRAQELDVRAALGAGSWRIARSLLVENALLASLGGALGLVAAFGALQALIALAPQRLPRLDAITLDGRSLTFAAVATLVAAVFFSVAPLLRAGRARLSTRLRGSRGASAGRAQTRAQNALVVGQVALALVLLVSSGLMIRTFEALRAVEPGFSAPASLQTFRVGVPQLLVPDPRAVWRLQLGITEAIEAIPGVESVAFTNALPMEEVGTNWDGIDVEGANNNSESMGLHVFNSMSPGYLTTMGMSLAAGRNLTFEDVEALRPVALVSERLARELWQTPEAALGHRIRLPGGGDSPWRDVIGVVADVRMNGLDEPAPTTVYWPTFMADFYRGVPFYVDRGVAFAVRSELAGSPALMRQIEQAVWSVNASLPVAATRTMQDIYDRSLGRTSFTLVMLLAAASAALVLGVVGLYGVLSYAVSTRRRELAIRLALGARARDLERRIVRQGVVLAGIGVVIGLAAAAGVTRLMTSLLYEVQAVDPLTYAAVAAGLIGVAALASYLPARRASSVDPAESLAAD